MKLKKTPIKFRQSLFWDVDPKTIDPEKNARYVIERILDLGDISDVRWMTQYYPASTIRDTLRKSKVISKKSKSLWSMVI